jgi:hypothetical protein
MRNAAVIADRDNVRSIIAKIIESHQFAPKSVEIDENQHIWQESHEFLQGDDVSTMEGSRAIIATDFTEGMTHGF